MKLNVLVGCEESQEVCKAFRTLGHEAYSCDLQECSGGHPEWHLRMDVFEAIGLKDWDIGIFFPDCTYMAVSGLHWNKNNDIRKQKTESSLLFVKRLMNCGISSIGIENPVGCISSRIRKPDQIIQPYNFGSDASKKTCLWLINLPALANGEYIEPRIVDGKKRWSNQTDDGQNKLIINDKWIAFNDPATKKHRAKTFPGIAKAIAAQWSEYIINGKKESQLKLAI